MPNPSLTFPADFWRELPAPTDGQWTAGWVNAAVIFIAVTALVMLLNVVAMLADVGNRPVDYRVVFGFIVAILLQILAGFWWLHRESARQSARIFLGEMTQPPAKFFAIFLDGTTTTFRLDSTARVRVDARHQTAHVALLIDRQLAWRWRIGIPADLWGATIIQPKLASKLAPTFAFAAALGVPIEFVFRRRVLGIFVTTSTAQISPAEVANLAAAPHTIATFVPHGTT